MNVPHLPPFPAAPPGLDRLAHMPTVVDGLRYWRAILATSDADSPSGRTAATMMQIYSEVREALLQAPDGSEPTPPAPPGRRARGGMTHARSADAQSR